MEHLAPEIVLFGIKFDLAAILMILVASIVVLILGVSAASKASVTNPGKLQNFLEWVVEFVENIIGSTLGSKYGKPFMTLGLTLIMFIFVGNMLGLPLSIVTEHTEPTRIFGADLVTPELLKEAASKAKDAHEAAVGIAWWKSPTADVSMTAALALTVIFLSHFLGLTRNTKHYLKHYVEPHWVMFPLNVIKEVSKPLTLALRLYGNIYAGEVMISVIMMAGFWGIIPLFVWQGFSVFVGAIQAFVFTMLTMVYISQNLIHEEH
ncbi:ATP synthase F0 subunit A [Gordoniibacillus kamchatkensis]|uniref:ATP synthase subunit a n=1 Tax=Gordoniibacillus kamchatkensis TaxID=1590651 RepID=A0ABR5AAE0_9BACL|nr:F0F1 ATP synthase subunit A [Paenibacillus sp. VKM B-2647]KIL37984.1 ATP synthase F0 subunit A [Paenibacillus sp. VKM B-2647]